MTDKEFIEKWKNIQPAQKSELYRTGTEWVPFYEALDRLEAAEAQEAGSRKQEKCQKCGAFRNDVLHYGDAINTTDYYHAFVPAPQTSAEGPKCKCGHAENEHDHVWKKEGHYEDVLKTNCARTSCECKTFEAEADKAPKTSKES